MFDSLDVLVVVITVFHLFMAPYTKVEESFNTQAMHDLLYHGYELGKNDHLEFPGVVPRTFLGAMIVSTLGSPFVTLVKLFQLPKLLSLYIVRLVLAGITLFTLHLLRKTITKSFGTTVSKAFALITAMQFHLLFYSSRPLPNIFAMACVILAYHFWIRGSPRETLVSLVFAMIVFRCDVLLLLAPVGLSLLLSKSVTFLEAVRWSVSAALVSAVLTFTVDSVMWRRWLWPEGEVFWFNSVLNRSSEWGVSPFHWYFTSALPRAMLAAFPLSILGLLLDRRVLKFVLPVFGFVILYSKLPHKELRFILFAVPMLNLSAAVAVSRLYNNRKKRVWSVVYRAVVFMFLASFCYTVLSAAASYVNYPGGHAMAVLHIKDNLDRDVQRVVHVDVFPAMTGVSRFCETEAPWKYSKKEGLSNQDLLANNYTYLLNAQSSVPGFKCLKAVHGFSRVALQRSSFPPVSLITEPQVYIHGVETQQWTNWPGC